MPYHQTTRLTAEELVLALANARKQEDRVLALFRRHGSLSPTLALDHYVRAGFDRVPLTSIRRAISDLCDAGYLMKTSLQVKGAWGKPEHVWRLADQAAIADLAA